MQVHDGSLNADKLVEHLIDSINKIRQVRSSHQRCSVGKGVLRSLAKFTGKHLCQSIFFNKRPHVMSL